MAAWRSTVVRIFSLAMDLMPFSRLAGASSYRPREDILFVFPAWRSHSVSSNRTEQARVSIAFNMTVTDRA